MIKKHLYCIFTFRKTTDAMAAEKLCIREGIPGRLIPLPTEISAGCGLAWRMSAEESEKYRDFVPNYERAVIMEM